MTRAGLRFAGIFAGLVLLSGHIGTDDVFFAGHAGPYDVRVTIKQPGVIPGLADISVRASGEGIRRVLVTALRRVENAGIAPPPDPATRVPGESDLFAAQLWLMTRGSHSVIVIVEGDAGTGQVTVPVMARATQRIAMTRGLGMVLAGGGLFLVIGLLTIFGTATRESVLGPDAEPSPADHRRGRWAMTAGGLLVMLIVLGGWRWISAEARNYGENVDRPWAVETAVHATEQASVLDLTITEERWTMRNDSLWRLRNGRYRRADLIPDHGKMMHMFVVAEPDLSAFAHVHPVRIDDNNFRVALPPLPDGRYRVYADIAHEDGSSRTLFATVDAPGLTNADPGLDDLAPDADDTWWTGAADEDGTSVLAGGSSLRWMNAAEPLVAGSDADLVFSATDSLGAPLHLEPYMGMRGHAMLNRLDGEVFMHLHPSGTISMAAQEALARAESAGERPDHAAMAMPAIDADESGVVRFPLVVPAAGRYRIWVQVKRGDQVLTGAFDADVT
jgi:hypothetical protein